MVSPFSVEAMQWNRQQRAFSVHAYFSRLGIIGPQFFQQNAYAVTANADLYSTMIQKFFFPAHRDMELDNVWFQQDGATAHTARISRNVLGQASADLLDRELKTGLHARLI